MRNGDRDRTRGNAATAVARQRRTEHTIATAGGERRGCRGGCALRQKRSPVRAILTGHRCSPSDLNDARLPRWEISVLLVKLVQIDHHVVSVSSDGETIHTAGRAALDERSVRAILGVVLRALKARLLLLPLQRRVLMWTCEGEHIYRPL